MPPDVLKQQRLRELFLEGPWKAREGGLGWRGFGAREGFEIARGGCLGRWDHLALGSRGGLVDVVGEA